MGLPVRAKVERLMSNSRITYILEFSQPLGSQHPRGQARYYVGSVELGTINRRMKQHRTGQGSAITRYAVQNGINFKHVATIYDDGAEQRIKAYKNTPKLLRSLQNGTCRLFTMCILHGA